MPISTEKIRDDFDALVASFSDLAITAVIDGESITSGVMSQIDKLTNELLDEGSSNETERWLRFKYDDLTFVPIANDSTATIDSVVYTITEVIVDAVKATTRVKLEDEYADL